MKNAEHNMSLMLNQLISSLWSFLYGSDPSMENKANQDDLRNDCIII